MPTYMRVMCFVTSCSVYLCVRRDCGDYNGGVYELVLASPEVLLYISGMTLDLLIIALRMVN